MPTALLHPLSVPPSLRQEGLSTVLKVVGPLEELVSAGIRTGVFLTRKQLASLMEYAKIQRPQKGSGRGKRGSVIKIDLGKAVIAHYHAAASEESKQAMVTALMGSEQPDVACPEEVVLAVEHMDPENSKDFSEIRKLCLHQKKTNENRQKEKQHQQREREKAMKAGSGDAANPPADEAASSSAPSSSAAAPRQEVTPRAPAATIAERKNFTPPELKPLLPGTGSLPGVYLKRNPAMKSYTGYYPAFSHSNALSRTHFSWLYLSHKALGPPNCQRYPDPWSQPGSFRSS